jgi:hypothetical protein
MDAISQSGRSSLIVAGATLPPLGALHGQLGRGRGGGAPISFTVARIFSADGNACQARYASQAARTAFTTESADVLVDHSAPTGESLVEHAIPAT